MASLIIPKWNYISNRKSFPRSRSQPEQQGQEIYGKLRGEPRDRFNGDSKVKHMFQNGNSIGIRDEFSLYCLKLALSI